MNFTYNILIHISFIIIKFLSFFNAKLKLFVDGRKNTFSELETIKNEKKTVWIHTASLGEFEQARPIIENLKTYFPKYKIVVTFFSPSGYEIRKNYTLADVICYLPFDTKKNVKQFLKIVSPKLAIIIKYEFWPNLLGQLKAQDINTILVSGIFREQQVFFRWYGGFMRKKLKAFNYFFVQDRRSKHLLNAIDFNNIAIAGDTRFDRVFNILEQKNDLAFIDEFKNNTYTLVAGSTWEDDERLLVRYINNNATEDEKFIIAPHNIHEKQIDDLQKSITKKTVRYSNKEGKELSNYQVIIIDTIGLLTKIYHYADVAYVGGGLKTNLHNTLEPAIFGIPLIFGNKKYKKFKEATDFIENNGATTIGNYDDLLKILTDLKLNKQLRLDMGRNNQNYIKKNLGATITIFDYINDYL